MSKVKDVNNIELISEEIDELLKHHEITLSAMMRILKEREDKRKADRKFEVGDEITPMPTTDDEIYSDECKIYVVITYTDGKEWSGFASRGKSIGQTLSGYNFNLWEKTGKHYDLISQAIEEMKR